MSVIESDTIEVGKVGKLDISIIDYQIRVVFGSAIFTFFDMLCDGIEECLEITI